MWFAIGGAVLFIVVVVVAVVSIVVITGGPGGAADDALMPGDDSVHPGEASSLNVSVSTSGMVAPLPRQPTLQPLPGYAQASENVQDGNDSTVILTADDGTTLIGIDATTAAPIFRTTAPAGARVRDCVPAGDRIGCTAEMTDESGTNQFGLAIIDAHTGAIIATTPVPALNESYAMYGTSDRIIVKTGPQHVDTLIAFDLSGHQVWTAQGSQVFPDAGIVVRDDLSPADATFLNAETGSPIAHLKYDGVYATAWEVYRDGVAILNPDHNGTDFYRADGTKLGSLKGWRPLVFQADEVVAAMPAPMVGRMANADVYDSSTIGAANPATGHLVWRIARQEFTGRRMFAWPIGHQIAVSVTDDGTVTGPRLVDDTSFQKAVVVLDPLTGQVVSARMAVPKVNLVADMNVSDGQRLIALRSSAVTAFDLTSGQQVWQLTTPGEYPSVTSSGHRIFVTPSESAVGIVGE